MIDTKQLYKNYVQNEKTRKLILLAYHRITVLRELKLGCIIKFDGDDKLSCPKIILNSTQNTCAALFGRFFIKEITKNFQKKLPVKHKIK